MAPSRREFLRTVAAGTVVAGTATGLTGCYFGTFDFLHGVASGDPLADRVILWTRITPDALLEDSCRQLEREAPRNRDARSQLE